MPWLTIPTPKNTTAVTFGGDLGNKISNYYNAIDVGVSDATNNPKIRTSTRFISGKLQLYGAAETFLISVLVPALNNNVNVTFPATLSNIANNEIMFKDLVQTVTGKLIDTATNTITGLGDGNIAVNANIAFAKISLVGSKLESIADLNITNRVAGSVPSWNASTLKWDMYSPVANPDVLLPNKTTPPVASASFVPVYRNDLDANNQRLYVSKIENGSTILVRLA